MASAEEQPAETLGLWLKQNAEQFLFAILLVIVVRHFSLTPFRIPSASMEPTLLGNQWTYDQLFVSRWSYLLSEPRRWDVCVFLYPLNESKHFVKRIAALPGETVFVADGDLYIAPAGQTLARIARKPPAVQESLWALIAQQPSAQVAAGEWIEQNDPTTEYVIPGSPDLAGDGVHVVGDLRVGADVGPLPDGSVVLLRIVSGNEVFDLELPAGGTGRLVHDSGELGEPLVLRVPRATPSGSFRVSLAHVDRQAIVQVNGERWLVHDYDALLPGGPMTPARARGGPVSSSAAIGARGAALGLSDVRFERDVHYTEVGLLDDREVGYMVPAGRYFMLGDNSPSSSDSRRWQVRSVQSGGRTYFSEGRLGPRRQLIDNNGRRRQLGRVDSERLVRLPRFTTVARNKLLGRAFAVYWPARRLRLIR